MTKGNEDERNNKYDYHGRKRFGHLTNIADIGDLVKVEGYGDKLFEVESYTHEINYDAESVYEEIIYDITDLETMEYLLAFQDDISVITRAEYLSSKKASRKKTDLSISFKDLAESLATAWLAEEEEEEPEPTTEELIDEQLTRISFYNQAAEIMDADGSNYFELLKNETKARLIELTNGYK